MQNLKTKKIYWMMVYLFILIFSLYVVKKIGLVNRLATYFFYHEDLHNQLANFRTDFDQSRSELENMEIFTSQFRLKSQDLLFSLVDHYNFLQKVISKNNHDARSKEYRYHFEWLLKSFVFIKKIFLDDFENTRFFQRPCPSKIKREIYFLRNINIIISDLRQLLHIKAIL